jgi:hypothetical protein
MNYYIITSTKYNDINKNLLQYKHVSRRDKSKVLIATTENVSEHVLTFATAKKVEEYTFSNHADWVGDGSVVFARDIISTACRYIQEVYD